MNIIDPYHIQAINNSLGPTIEETVDSTDTIDSILELIGTEISRLDTFFNKHNPLLVSSDLKIKALEQLKKDIKEAKTPEGEKIIMKLTLDDIIEKWENSVEYEAYSKPKATTSDMINAHRFIFFSSTHQEKTSTAKFIDKLKVNHGEMVLGSRAQVKEEEVDERIRPGFN